jgi:hypothetical protein
MGHAAVLAALNGSVSHVARHMVLSTHLTPATPHGPPGSAALAAAALAVASAPRLAHREAAAAACCAVLAASRSASHASWRSRAVRAASTVRTAHACREERLQAAPTAGASLGNGGLCRSAHRRAAQSGTTGAAACGTRTATALRTATMGTGAHSQSLPP